MREIDTAFAEAIASLNERRERRKREAVADADARDFWERCVLAWLTNGDDAALAVDFADMLTAEWRKRFDPREKK